MVYPRVLPYQVLYHKCTVKPKFAKTAISHCKDRNKIRNNRIVLANFFNNMRLISVYALLNVTIGGQEACIASSIVL